jgi:hypothetical protein
MVLEECEGANSLVYSAEIATVPDHPNDSAASIQCLPEEILSEILRLSLECPGRPWGCPAFAVCRRWRNCAIGSPRLWSTIEVIHGRSSEGILASLERSCSAPLYIKLWLRDSSIRPMMEVVGCHWSRCFQLNIDVARDVKDDDLLLLFPFSLDLCSLRKLDIYLNANAHYGIRSRRLFSANDQHATPALQELVIRSHPGYFGRGVNISCIRCADLTEMVIGQAVDPVSVWEILPRCTSLQHLDWESSAYITRPRGCDQFTLNALRSASLSIHHPSTLFEAVQLPSLRRLHLSLPTSVDEIRKIVAAGQLCSLSHLGLSLYSKFGFDQPETLPDSLLLSLFSQLDNVEDLFLGSNMCGLQYLASQQQPADLSLTTLVCPKLRVLRLDVDQAIEDTLSVETLSDILSELCRQRKNQNIPFQTYINVSKTRLNLPPDLPIYAFEERP